MRFELGEMEGGSLRHRRRPGPASRGLAGETSRRRFRDLPFFGRRWYTGVQPETWRSAVDGRQPWWVGAWTDER